MLSYYYNLFDYYELISINYADDINNIYNILTKSFPNNKITYKKYYPFFEFFDKRIEYYYDNILILKVYGNNNRCIVYHESKKKKSLFGTFQLVILYLLSNYNYYIINKNIIEENNNMLMITNMNNIKNIYLDKNNKTVVDKTPFQDFSIKCIGTPYDPMRESQLSRDKKFKQGLKVTFKYEPSNKPGKIPNLIFSNSSGNEIIKNNK